MKARGFVFALLASIVLAVAADTTNGVTPRVDVILWFDTEDYLLPASDDAAKRLAEMLSQRNVRATFKVVGEKARTLERRGRADVIAALGKHTIAYHSDFHSVHPTPTEYLADCGLVDGIAEFVRREGDGAADVRRIFRVPTLACYGQPGSSWAPQAVAGLKQIGVAPGGVPCYVDEGTHVGLDEKPFWYAGALNVYHMGQNYTRMELHDPSVVASAKQKVSDMASRLATEGGGLISIFYHPCEWVHRQFWDGVNFSRGANPPREEWKAPPQRTAEETEGAFQRFGEYVDHIRKLPHVKFITAAELPAVYRDRATQDGASKEDVAELARRIKAEGTNGLNFQVISNNAFSVADQFELLVSVLAHSARGATSTYPARVSGLLGPDAVFDAAATTSKLDRVSWPALRDALFDVNEFIVAHRRIPARVFVGAYAIAPADFLVALASAFDSMPTAAKLSGPGVSLPRERVAVTPEKYVAKDTPGLFGGWVIHKEGFRAPKLMELARLQAWTLKPAIRAE